ncbi:MAG: hypothetical protein V4489_02905 [Chlamydiota bacterium]
MSISKLGVNSRPPQHSYAQRPLSIKTLFVGFLLASTQTGVIGERRDFCDGLKDRIEILERREFHLRDKTNILENALNAERTEVGCLLGIAEMIKRTGHRDIERYAETVSVCENTVKELMARLDFLEHQKELGAVRSERAALDGVFKEFCPR